ncbi:DEAD/DEAH box helicase (plasmid) [Burkholderia vietnamiensis]|nr:DEAD/DEAH box helicase [Burkholderia vietnamiensis]
MRDLTEEAIRLEEASASGLKELVSRNAKDGTARRYGFRTAQEWQDFIGQEVPPLREKGWKVTYSDPIAPALLPALEPEPADAWRARHPLDENGQLILDQGGGASRSVKSTSRRASEPNSHSSDTQERSILPTPDPILNLHSGFIDPQAAEFRYRQSDNILDYAKLSFNYRGSLSVQWDEILLADGEQRIRNRGEEERRVFELQSFGMVMATHRGRTCFVFNSEYAWRDFATHTVPILRRRGWLVRMNGDFRFNETEIEFINGELHGISDGTFEVEMGIVVDGRRVRLEPLLVGLVHRDPRWTNGHLNEIDDEEPVEFRLEDGMLLRIKAVRIKPIVANLMDLLRRESSSIRFSRLDFARINELTTSCHFTLRDGSLSREDLRELVEGLSGPIPDAPKGFHGALKQFQREGLRWLQFLGVHGLSGILADEMGLGKTVQSIAHVLQEKEGGRLDRPALVILPRALLGNWDREIKKFAPKLHALVLSGAKRREFFNLIDRSDVVLTTYGQLVADITELRRHKFHLIILDEAQNVKNASTHAAAAIRLLVARQRICLTGTPLENHLGELWSQFDFLLPGFLGTRREFAHDWRTPIERRNDTSLRSLLARRVRPFILRRTKEQVAIDLPPKSVITRTIGFDQAQHDLYETVRASAQFVVREAVADRGLGRSTITVLSQILKLRQVCCDPRLLRLEQSEQKKPSAKLEYLMNMLRELLGDGRRVVVFSAFLTMVDIIADRLRDDQVEFEVITGETQNTDRAKERFQNQEVPLLLCTLKVGGVGHNLTAADTVILYDPWWNPAAENQAMDRAHRIGQTKALFVYKLIMAGSIEERIVAMQERKDALMKAILDDDFGENKLPAFTEEDVEALLAPLSRISVDDMVSPDL